MRMRMRGMIPVLFLLLLTTACGNSSKENLAEKEQAVTETFKEDETGNTVFSGYVDQDYGEREYEEEALSDEEKVSEDDGNAKIVETNQFCVLDDQDVQELCLKDVVGNRIYVLIKNADPDQDYQFTSYTCRQYDLEGNVLSEYTKEIEDGYAPLYVKMDENGNTYSIMDDHSSYDGSFSGDKNEIWFKIHSADGEELLSYDLKKNFNDEKYHVIDMERTKEGEIILLSTAGLEVIYKDGTYGCCFNFEDKQGVKLKSVQNGNLIVLAKNDNTENNASYVTYMVNLKEGVLESEVIDTPIEITPINCNTDSDYDLLLSDDHYLYGYDIEDNWLGTLIDYQKSGLDGIEASNVYYLSNREILIMEEPTLDSIELYGKIYDYALRLE